MAIEFKSQKFTGRAPEIWRGDCKILPGGFKPTQTFPTDFVLHRGTPIYVDFATMTAEVCKGAKVQAGSTATAIKVVKGHLFQLNDVVIKSGEDGTTSATITAIDRTATGFDTITISADLSTAENDYIVLKDGKAPNAVAGADVRFTDKGFPTIDAAYEAVVLYPNLAFDVLPAWQTGICLKSNPNIVFIKQ